MEAPVACDSRIHAARSFCPYTGFASPASVTIRNDCIVAIGRETELTAHKEWHFPHAILLPGLIDLHAHPAMSGSRWGVDPDVHLLPRGTTTALSQGDAGADQIESYIRDTIQSCQTRIRLAINLSRCGEAGPGGCFEDLAWADVPACIAAIERHREHVWGIAVNVSHHCCGQTDPKEILRRGLAVATQTGLPILFGLRRPEDWPLAEQLALLRPGDVVTYCYRRTPHCIVENGRVLPEVKDARMRGVLFDLGHGTTSFDFTVAEAALQDGFPPDTISTDWQRAHLDQAPPHDLPLVMSKLRAAGMPEADIFRAATLRPAEVLHLDHEIGTLRAGQIADLTLLEWKSTDGLPDASGNRRPGGRWETVAVLRAGHSIKGF